MKVMRRKILKWSMIAASVVVILFLALGIHLYYVTDNFYQNTPANSSIRLARIDFDQPVDSVEANKIKQKVNTLPGVEKSYFNISDNILVYSYNKDVQSPDNVYKQVMNQHNYQATRFVVAEKDMSSGCPAMSDKASSGLLLIYKKMFSIF
jgi:hypothetical protein